MCGFVQSMRFWYVDLHLPYILGNLVEVYDSDVLVRGENSRPQIAGPPCF